MDKLVIIKLGSNILVKNGHFNFSLIVNLAENVQYLKQHGYQPVIVSSGACAAGREYLHKNRPDDMDPVLFEQMCSSVGQPLLMHKYINVFGEYKIKVAQALITQDVFHNKSYCNSFMNMVAGHISIGVVPIINENDALDSREIVFSDNDMLSALVAYHLKAERLIILSNVDGLCHRHPDEGGELIAKIHEITDETYSFANPRKSTFGRGGMKSKIETAEFMLKHGIHMHLVNGERRDAIKAVVRDEPIGTHFCPLG